MIEAVSKGLIDSIHNENEHQILMLLDEIFRAFGGSSACLNQATPWTAWRVAAALPETRDLHMYI